MKYRWCWRCRTEVPMLNEEEYVEAHRLYGVGFRARKRRVPHEDAFGELLRYFTELTGFVETEPNAIMHHRDALYGVTAAEAVELIAKISLPNGRGTVVRRQLEAPVSIDLTGARLTVNVESLRTCGSMVEVSVTGLPNTDGLQYEWSCEQLSGPGLWGCDDDTALPTARGWMLHLDDWEASSLVRFTLTLSTACGDVVTLEREIRLLPEHCDGTFELVASPNPTTGEVTLIYSESETDGTNLPSELIVSDVYRNIKIRRTYESSPRSFSVYELKDGLYSVTVRNGERTAVTHIIKQSW